MPETLDTPITEPIALETTTVAPERQSIGNFGNGRYSGVAGELYRDAQRLLKLQRSQADKLARAFSSELGKLNSQVKSVGISKPNKDGGVTLREACVTKGVTMTNSLALAKLCVLLQDAKRYGATDFAPTIREDIVEWLNA